MIDKKSLGGKRIAIFGLGTSGVAASLALKGYGAHVLAWDDNEDSRAQAQKSGVMLSDLYSSNWETIDALVLAPGVPLHHPEPHPIVKRAQTAGCEVIGDIEILGRIEESSTFIGITGTNGKSTTTALIGHILQSSKYRVETGGNLGRPALAMDSLDSLGKEGCYVLEMSSYQIDLTPTLNFDVAILLNITPDHLERHGGMDGYCAAKAAIFGNQNERCTAIVGIDSEPSYAILKSLQDQAQSREIQRIIPISGSISVPGGIYAQDGMLIDDTESKQSSVMDLRTLQTLRGEHNWQNVAAAYACAHVLDVDRDQIVERIKYYPGLVHRQEVVEIIDGVLFVNDSKATNPDATARALASYDNIYWIAGGQPKEGGFDPLLPYLDNVHHAYLIGDGAKQLHDTIGPRVPCTLSGTIDSATAVAYRQAMADGDVDPVVLLSPACASFDQFKNFEERGNHFKNSVSALHSENYENRSAS